MEIRKEKYLSQEPDTFSLGKAAIGNIGTKVPNSAPIYLFNFKHQQGLKKEAKSA